MSLSFTSTTPSHPPSSSPPSPCPRTPLRHLTLLTSMPPGSLGGYQVVDQWSSTKASPAWACFGLAPSPTNVLYNTFAAVNAGSKPAHRAQKWALHSYPEGCFSLSKWMRLCAVTIQHSYSQHFFLRLCLDPICSSK